MIRRFLALLLAALPLAASTAGTLILQSGPRLFVEAPQGDTGSLRILGSGGSGDQAHARLDTIPDGFGDAEFAFEIWIKPTQGLTVASTAATKVNRWSSDASTIYTSGADWWYLGNFLLDGHNNSDFSEGTFSLQLTASGRVQWTFGDGAAAAARTGEVHGTRSDTAILTDAWHQIIAVRRWDGGSGAILELWVNGVLEDTETTTARTNMATIWDSWTGYPANQQNWFFGAEKISALGGTEWEHYMGLIDEIRFYNRAPTTGELEAGEITSGLLADYDFDEGSGTSVAGDGGASMTLVDADQYQWVTDDGAPVAMLADVEAEILYAANDDDFEPRLAVGF